MTGSEVACKVCGNTDHVETTDERLPVTEAHPAEGSTGCDAPPHNPGESSADPQVMRVESISVTAVPHPSEGNITLRVVPHVTYRNRLQHEMDEPDNPPQPACSALIARLKATAQQQVECVRDPCVICANEIETDALVTELPCGHAFHDECIRMWLSQQHTCPCCRFELEEDNARYLRSIGLREQAEFLEEVEQMRRDCERQKRLAVRRRWMKSLRKGEPVHFGLTCSRCEMTPLVGVCYRCEVCEQHILCSDCYMANGDSDDGSASPTEHTFVPVQSSNSNTTGHGTGTTSTLTFSMRAVSTLAQPEEGAGQSESALAAAEAAFMAVRSLALAPVGAPAASLRADGMFSGGCTSSPRMGRSGRGAAETRPRSAERDHGGEDRGRTRHQRNHARRTRSSVHRARHHGQY